MGNGLENVINRTKNIIKNAEQTVRGLAYSAAISLAILGVNDGIEQAKAQPEYNSLPQSAAQETTTASTASTSELKADLNGDYVVNFKDLAVLADQWLATEGDRKVIPVCDCQELSEPNAIYVLQNSIAGDEENCITIKANNITLDLNGHVIGGNEDSTKDNCIFNSGYDQTTIKNGIINDTYDTHIYLNNGQGHVLNNLTIGKASSNNPNSDHGIFLESVTNSTISNIDIENFWTKPFHLKGVNDSEIENIWTSNNRFERFYIEDCHNNNFTNLTIDRGGIEEGEGIYLESSSGNIFDGIKMVDSNSDAYLTKGIEMISSSYNTLQNMTIENCGNDCLYLENSSNNKISDTIITNNVFPFSDISLFSSSINNTLLNVSYNASQETVAEGSSLIRKWSYAANVIDDSNSPISDARVWARDKNNALEFMVKTTETGDTPGVYLTDYINSGGEIEGHTPYTITAEKGTMGDAHIYEPNGFNLEDGFTLSE